MVQTVTPQLHSPDWPAVSPEVLDLLACRAPAFVACVPERYHFQPPRSDLHKTFQWAVSDQLQSLRAEGCELDMQTVSCLTTLTRLEFSHPQTAEGMGPLEDFVVPEGPHLRNLRVLSLVSCGLVRVPEALRLAPNLLELYLHEDAGALPEGDPGVILTRNCLDILEGMSDLSGLYLCPWEAYCAGPFRGEEASEPVVDERNSMAGNQHAIRALATLQQLRYGSVSLRVPSGHCETGGGFDDDDELDEWD